MMSKLGSSLIQKHLTPFTSPLQPALGKSDWQFHVAPSFGAPYRSYRVRTLKAVYPHFAEAKRLSKENSHPFHETLNGEDLKTAMEEAKSDYQMMRDIQQQLNQAYQQFKTLKISS
jgi:hypothetical protein